MSFVKYLALRGSRAGGLFPASGKLDTLVRDVLRVPGFGRRTNTLCWYQYKDPVENSPLSSPCPQRGCLHTAVFHDPRNEARAQL